MEGGNEQATDSSEQEQEKEDHVPPPTNLDPLEPQPRQTEQSEHPYGNIEPLESKPESRTSSESQPINTTSPDSRPINTDSSESQPINIAPPDTQQINAEPSESQPIDTAPSESQQTIIAPPDSQPINTAPPDSQPINTAPPDSQPISKAPPVSQPINTAPPDSQPINTAPPDSQPINTTSSESQPVNAARSESQPVNIAPPDTQPINTAPPDSKPVNTAPPDSQPIHTAPPDSQPRNAVPSGPQPSPLKPLKPPPEASSESNVSHNESGSSTELEPISAEEKARKMEEDYNALGVKRCPSCNFTTDDEVLFKIHLTVCTKKQVSKTGQILLSYSNGVYSCKTCCVTWEIKAEFDEHVVCHISEDPYVCLTCKKNFSSRQLIEQHARQEHANGDSKCGLRGMKKGRQFVKEMEINGSLTLLGRVKVPKTPRSQSSKPVKNDQKQIKEDIGITKSDSIITTPPIPQQPVASYNEPTSNKSNTGFTENDTSALELKSTLLTHPIQSNGPVITSTSELVQKNTPAVLLVSQISETVRPTTLTQLRSILPRSTEVVRCTSETDHPKTPTIVPVYQSPSKNTSVCTNTMTSTVQVVEKSQTSETVHTASSTSQFRSILPKQIEVMNCTSETDHSNTPTISPVSQAPSKTTSPVCTTTMASAVQAVEKSPAPMLVDKTGPFLLKLQSGLASLTSARSLNVKTQVNVPPPITSTQNNDYTTSEINTSPYTSQTTAKVNLTSGSNNHQGNQSSFFGIVDKSTGDFKQATPPCSIQKLVEQKVPKTDNTESKSPGYHIKDITEYTMPERPSPATTTTTVGSQAMLLIPVGPVIPPGQHNMFPRLPVTVVQSVSTKSPVMQSNPSSQGMIFQQMPVRQNLTNQLLTRLPQLLTNKNAVSPSITNTNVPVVPVNNPTPIINQVLQGNSVNATFTDTAFSALRQSTSTSNSSVPSATAEPEIAGQVSRSANTATAIITSIPVAQTNSSQPLLANNTTPVTKFMFRIKPGNGFVCEACKKYTKDELIFRNHIWNHFHMEQKACLSCTFEHLAKGAVHKCQLVNSIVCNLIKRSRLETERIIAEFGEGEVISISDDEDEKGATLSNQSKTDVIVLDDEETVNSGFKIHIASAHSISVEEYDAANLGEKGTLAEISVQSNIESHNADVDNTEKLPIEIQPIDKISNIEENASKPKPESNRSKDILKATSSHDENKTDPQTQQRASNVADRTDSKVNDAARSVSEKRENLKLAPETREIFQSNQNIELDHTHKTNNASDTTDLDIMSSKETLNAFYICGYEHCNFTAFTSNKYKSHLRAKHMDEYNFICCHCGMKDFTEDSHFRHLHSHASSKSFALYKCPVRLCSYKSNTLQYYMYHLNAHIPEEMNLKCVYCHKTFETAEKLQYHLRDNILKMVNCSFCSFKFGKRAVVMQHIRKAHPDKLRFVTVTAQILCLDREINFYNPPPNCETFNARGENANEHINIPAILEQVRKESVSCDDNKSIDDNENRKNAEVERLDKINISKDARKQKKGKHVGPKSLLCPHVNCNYLSYNLALHTKHVSLHDTVADRDRRFVCNFCPASMEALGAFKKHVVNHVGRNEIKVYSCTLCGFNTNLKSHIMDHCQDNHDGKGMYTCTPEVVISSEISCKFCEFKSRQADQVVLHEKHVHHVDSVTSAKEPSDTRELSESSPQKEPENAKKYKYHCDYCDKFFKHKVQLIQHLQEDHNDIKDKQFTFYKCKYCPLGSTRKDMLVTHLGNEHPGEVIRILRKIERVENKPELELRLDTDTNNDENAGEDIHEEVAIPDGNVFKNPFRCPKCSFTTLVRLNAMRHLKEHPNLKPVRDKDAPSKKTARKSTSQKLGQPKTHNALYQPTQLKKNPFTAVKEAVDKLKESDKPQNTTYSLGEDDLHSILTECFTPIEKDIKFKCKICNQDIYKKFVLHRHILDHLNVVFYKCQYCEDGSVEKTLLFGHIQKKHPQQSLLYHQLSKVEIDNTIKARISKQNFSSRPTKMTSPKEKKQQSIVNAIGSPSSKIGAHDETRSRKIYKCTYSGCVYQAFRINLFEHHLMYHGDKTKNYKCSLCHYRNEKYIVLAHIYKQHRGTYSARAVLVDDHDDGCADTIQNKDTSHDGKSVDTSQDTDKSSRESSIDSMCSLISSTEGKYLTNKQGKKVKVEALTISNNGVYEMRIMFKCKDCGAKRDTKTSINRHIQTSKCKRPTYQCSFCSFQRYTKKDIKKHARIRHTGKKLEIVTLPRSAKVAKMNIPVRQNFLNETSVNVKRESSNAPLNTSEGDLENKNEVRCGLCEDFTCQSVMKLQFHVNTVHDGRLLLCKECQYKTPLVKHMINHCTNVHLQKIPRYKNDMIDENTIEEKKPAVSVSPASAKSLGLEPYACVLCEFEHTKSQRLKYHYHKHFNFKPYVCKYCDVASLGKCNIQRHVANRHPGKAVKYDRVKNPALEKKIEEHFERSKSLRQSHIKAKGLVRKRTLPLDNDTESQARKKAKVVKTKQVVLKQKTGGGGENMKFKVRLGEDGRRIFKCYRCEFTSKEKNDVKNHMATHVARFFKCFYCSYSTKIRSNAFRHCRHKHGDKKVKVTEKKTGRVLTPKDLEIGFSESTNSSSEMSGRLRYNCCICDETFGDVSLFEGHLSSHAEFQGHEVNFNARVDVSLSDKSDKMDSSMDVLHSDDNSSECSENTNDQTGQDSLMTEVN